MLSLAFEDSGVYDDIIAFSFLFIFIIMAALVVYLLIMLKAKKTENYGFRKE